jgi:hypothetical protein
LGVCNDSKEIITFKTYISKQEMSEIQQEIHADSMTLFEVENKISVHPAFRDHCMERPGMVREYLKKVLGLNL